MAKPNSSSMRCRRCGWPRRSKRCATSRIDTSEGHRRAAKDLPRQSRHTRRLHRARHLCEELFRDRRHRGDRHARVYRSGGACRRVQGFRRGAGVPVLIRQGLCRARGRRRQRPFKPLAQGISIWQGGPASRKPRCAPPALTISSLPAATRWRCCRTPGGGWSEHDIGDQTRSDRRLPMRRRSLCAVGARRPRSASAIAGCARRRPARRSPPSPISSTRTSAGPGASRPRSAPPRSPSAISARHCGTPLSFRRIDGPRIEIMTGAFDRPDRVVPTRQYGTESRLGWVVGDRQFAEPDHAAELRPGEAWRASSATSIRTMIESGDPGDRMCYNG